MNEGTIAISVVYLMLNRRDQSQLRDKFRIILIQRFSRNKYMSIIISMDLNQNVHLGIWKNTMLIQASIKSQLHHKQMLFKCQIENTMVLQLKKRYIVLQLFKSLHYRLRLEMVESVEA